MSKDEFMDISWWSPVKITRENIKRAMIESAPKYAKGRLVDVGCGIKPYERIFAGHVESYFGVDFQGTAEGNYGELTKADLFADCTDTGLEAGSFDTLISTQVMEHVLDTRKYVSECHRLLKAGGYGIFTVPFVWQCHAEPYDFYRFTKYALEGLFRNQGFEIVEVKGMEGAYASVLQTEIVSLYLHTSEMAKTAQRINNIRRRLFLPWLNWKGLHLDRFFYNGKLCLNYLVVVRK